MRSNEGQEEIGNINAETVSGCDFQAYGELTWEFDQILYGLGFWRIWLWLNLAIFQVWEA